MSEAPRHALIRTPRQLIVVVLAAFAIPVITIALIVSYVENTSHAGAGVDRSSTEAVAQRVAPVGQVVMAAPASAASGATAAPAAAASGPAAVTARAADGSASVGVTQAGATSAGDMRTPPDASSASAPPAAGANATPTTEANATPAAGTSPAAPAAAPQSAAAGAAPAADTQLAGKTLYTQVCQACHATGVLGSPKFGDKAAWAPRLKDPMDVIYNYALHGKGAMPAKGGSNASDADVKAAVDYMVNAAK